MSESEQPDTDDVKVFVSDEEGPEEFAAFFEDDGETGYLYVSDRRRGEVIRHLQIYTNSKMLGVEEGDVRVTWSQDGTKCGVVIWGGMRGIIDMVKNQEGRVLLENRETPPIADRGWLEGFPT